MNVKRVEVEFDGGGFDFVFLRVVGRRVCLRRIVCS